MYFLGIDPGKTGAFVLLDSNGRIIGKEVTPVIGSQVCPRAMFNLVFGMKKLGLHAIVEKVGSRPGEFHKACFTFGKYAGYVEACLAAAAIAHTFVTPVKWQNTMLVGVERKLDTKKRALIAARRIWPTEDFLATERSKKPHDGIVDAALLAEYGRRTLGRVTL